MDPNATWTLLIEMYVRRDWDEVVEAAEALLTWLQRGGFPPDVMRDHEVGSDWNRVLAETGCHFALQQAVKVLSVPDGIPGDVPFTLSCFDCDADGPPEFEAAVAEGWRNIEYVPNALSSNFLGCCPEHREDGAD